MRALWVVLRRRGRRRAGGRPVLAEPARRRERVAGGGAEGEGDRGEGEGGEPHLGGRWGAAAEGREGGCLRAFVTAELPAGAGEVVKEGSYYRKLPLCPWAGFGKDRTHVPMSGHAAAHHR